MEEQVVEQQVEQPTEQTAQPKSSEANLSAMRKKLEAEESARISAERRAADLEQRLQNSPQNSQTQVIAPLPEEEDFAVDNEDYVQAKHIKTSNKKMKIKLSETERKLLELEQKLSYFEAKVDTDTLKDFNTVVSEDNLKSLARLYPDDYQTMMANPNLKAKSKTAYNMIKNYGIVNNNDVEQRINANKQKPQMASVGAPQQPQTPLSRLNDYDRRVLTDDDRDRIMQEVERKKRGPYNI